MRNLAILADPVVVFANSMVGYVGAVLGVIGIASLAFFNLQAMAAKAHRHWDADIERIIATQQVKKQSLELATLARTDRSALTEGSGPRIAALTTGARDDQGFAFSTETTGLGAGSVQRPKTPGAKRSGKRTDRKRQHFIPAAFATLPKFASTAAATTTTLFRLR